MNQPDDVPFVDYVAAYCAFHHCTAKTLQHKTFGEVLRLLHEARDKYPEYVSASQQIRRQYGICHEDCHIERILMVVAEMKEMDKPQAPSAPGVVLPFPTNSTKH